MAEIKKLTVGDLKKYFDDFSDLTPVWIESGGELEPVMGIEDHENGTDITIIGEI